MAGQSSHSQTVETKELLSHPLYEQQRRYPADSAEWQDYQDQINQIWRPIRDDPPNLVGAP